MEGVLEVALMSSKKPVLAFLVGLAIVTLGCSTAGGSAAPAASGAGGSAAAGGSALPASETISKVKSAGTMRVGYAAALPWLGQDTKTNEWFGPNDLLGKKLAEKLGV